MTKHRSPDERAEQILTAARACFLEEGYFATKMDTIARHSGLSKGGIYFHFESKRDIFLALVQEEYDASMGLIDNIVSQDHSITEVLLELAEHFMQLFASTDRPRFMVIMGEMALRDQEVATLLRELQLNYFKRISQLLDRSVEDGQIRSCDTYAVAIVLKSLLDGVQANFALGIEMDLEATITAAMEILVNGLTPKG
ncbi:MAG: TetR/AcrR family transcriptional regulator [bacterium]